MQILVVFSRLFPVYTARAKLLHDELHFNP